MLRITVYGRDGSWSFRPGAEAQSEWPSAMSAARAACAFGDDQEGFSAGYIVRLTVQCESGDAHAFTLETRVFDPAAVRLERSSV